jgi:hypothetical protein
MNAIAKIEPADVLPSATSLSLALPDGLSFERWQELGRELCAREKVLNWWIGDWWAFGDHRYGERARIAAEGVFGIGFGALRNSASICRSFETSRRRDTLSWSHHAEVAALPPEEADALLERAVAENLSTRNLRIEAMKAKLHLGILRPRDRDDDWAYKSLKAIAAAWNRADHATREEFASLVAESGMGVIEV